MNFRTCTSGLIGLIITVTVLLLPFGHAASKPGTPQSNADPPMANQWDPAFFVRPVDMLNRYREHPSDLLFVDVRSEKDFAKAQIPGSLNIQLFAIKAKAFLKPKELVIIGDGRSCSDLQRTCVELISIGFNARILFGGLNHWHQSGGPVQGDFFKIQSLKFISPQSFFANRSCGNWIVIDATDHASTAQWEKQTNTAMFPFYSDLAKLSSALNSTIAKSKSPFIAALVLNDTGAYDPKIHAALGDAGIRTISYLQGGKKAYDRFFSDLAQMQKGGKTTRTRSCRRCGSCP